MHVGESQHRDIWEDHERQKVPDFIMGGVTWDDLQSIVQRPANRQIEPRGVGTAYTPTFSPPVHRVDYRISDLRNVIRVRYPATRCDRRGFRMLKRGEFFERRIAPRLECT